MAYIEIKDVSKIYERDGEPFHALSHVSLEIEKGEFICLLGPSGCGKTTLLSMLAGFELPDSGKIIVGGEDVIEPVPNRVTIFQHYGLLPWQTVEKNVMLGLLAKKVPRAKAREIARKYIDLVGLSGFEQVHPAQLSGGMQQRVSIARGLAVQPDVLFMDEPFAALDAITRLKMQDDIHRIAAEEGITVVFVTHDIEEAVVLADRIVVLTPNPGQVKEVVPVELGPDRLRTGDDFLAVRDHVFDVFGMKPNWKVDYVI